MNTSMPLTQLIRYLPVLIPLALIELGLMIAALIHILTHPQYRFGNRVIWIIVVICVNIIGPILYFILGRSDEGTDNDEDDEGPANSEGRPRA